MTTPSGYVPLDSRTIKRFGEWERKFIWCSKINGRWVIMREVWRRSDIFGFMRMTTFDGYDYALDDFEMIIKSGKG